MSVTFFPSPTPTLGVELELQILDRRTGELVPGAEALLSDLDHPKRIKHELFLNTVEINTDVCRTVAEARADLERSIETLRALCEPRGWTLGSTGTHPSALWEDQPITPNPRYKAIVERNQLVSRRLLIWGIHVHVGVPHAEEAVAVQNALSTFIPHFLALSASSPFFRGRDTGYASIRTKLFEQMATAGIPHRVANWGEYVRFMTSLQAAGTIETVREVWTDVRPHPDLGTVENRICDAVPTLGELTALVALAHASAVWLGERYREGRRLPIVAPWIVRDNKWRAARWGLDAEIIVDDDGRLSPVRTAIRELVRDLLPTAERLGCAEALAGVEAILRHGTSAARQRRVYEQTGDLAAVTLAAAAEFEADRVEEVTP